MLGYRDNFGMESWATACVTERSLCHGFMFQDLLKMELLRQIQCLLKMEAECLKKFPQICASKRHFTAHGQQQCRTRSQPTSCTLQIVLSNSGQILCRFSWPCDSLFSRQPHCPHFPGSPHPTASHSETKQHSSCRKLRSPSVAPAAHSPPQGTFLHLILKTVFPPIHWTRSCAAVEDKNSKVCVSAVAECEAANWYYGKDIGCETAGISLELLVDGNDRLSRNVDK
jgi:hypothetical protein